MPAVETADAVICRQPERRARELIPPAADDVPHRMAAEEIPAEQHDIHREDERADADAEDGTSGGGIRKPHGLPGIERENDQDEQGNEQHVTVNVLQNQRKRILAPVCFPWLTDRARGRIAPEGFVVRAAIVVARHAEETGDWQNEQRR